MARLIDEKIRKRLADELLFKVTHDGGESSRPQRRRAGAFTQQAQTPTPLPAATWTAQAALRLMTQRFGEGVEELVSLHQEGAKARGVLGLLLTVEAHNLRIKATHQMNQRHLEAFGSSPNIDSQGASQRNAVHADVGRSSSQTSTLCANPAHGASSFDHLGRIQVLLPAPRVWRSAGSPGRSRGRNARPIGNRSTDKASG